MTENEEKAVKFIENIKSHATVTLDHIAKEEPNVSPLIYKGREEKADTILKMIEELRQYRAIGTPEECRAAMEKQKPMNVLLVIMILVTNKSIAINADKSWEMMKNERKIKVVPVLRWKSESYFDRKYSSRWDFLCCHKRKYKKE